jgi:protein-tyrosine phosphatase
MPVSTTLTRSRFLGFDHLGGRRAALTALLYRGAAVMGVGARYRSLDAAAIDRLVFVCRGNICRSPFAQAVAERLGFEAASFGIEADRGAAPPAAAIRVAREHGFDVSQHRAARGEDIASRASDLVVAFEPSHLASLPRSCAGQRTLMGAWAPRPTLYIHDPHGASDAHFARCFETIESAIRMLVARIREAHANERR